MTAFNEIINFLNNFYEKEYYFLIKQNKLNCTRDEYINELYSSLNDYMIPTSFGNFSELTVWPINLDEKERNEFLESCCKRQTFIIEKYQGASYVPYLENLGTSNILYVCYVGHSHKFACDYYSRKFLISSINNQLKIITVERQHSDLNWAWAELDDVAFVKDYGKFIEALKIQAPSREEDLKHYNSY